MTQETEKLQKEIDELKEKNQELQETLDAIRSGEVDAIVVSRGDFQRIYTLEGTDYPYRTLIENIREGALSLTRTGIILYCNTRFTDIVKMPPEKILGTSILDYICPEYRPDMLRALTDILKRESRIRVRIRQGSSSVPVLVSMSPRSSDEDTKISVVITDRRKDEDRIHLQSRMLDAVGDAVIAVDINQKIIYWNNAATKIYGWKQDEVLGHAIEEVIIFDNSKKVAQDIDTRLKKGMIWSGDLVVRHHDGHKIPIYLSCGPIFDDDGKIIAFIKVSHDITERRQAEEALRDSEKTAKAILGAVKESIWLFNTNGTILIANPTALERLGGRDAGEVIGHQFEEFMIADVAQKSRVRLDDVISSRQPLSFVEERSGIIYDHTFYPVFNDNGSVKNIVVFSLDITERKRTEEMLRVNEEKYHSLAENIPSILMRYNQNLQVVYLSPNAENITGKHSSEFIGKTNREVGMPEDLTSLWETAISEVFLSGQQQDLEFQFFSSTGTKTFYLKLAPERDQTGMVRYVLGISTDISDRKQMEEELRERHNKLIVLNEKLSATQMVLQQNLEDIRLREYQLNEALTEKEVLLSEVHHRVKNNLTAFISLLSLDGYYEDSEGGRALRKDLQNRARSMALIHDTLYKTRKFSNVDMEIYLTTLVGQITNSYNRGTGILTIVNASGVSLDLARATPAGLIINELVTNSYKYAFPPGFNCKETHQEPCNIQVSLVCEDGMYVLTVSDNGRGLPPDFDPLTTKSLGLKLVKFLACHQLRADIEVRGDKGTEFIFRLHNREDCT